jgi:alpha-tubulin suppressor-like RCC1 family protein
VLRRIGSTVAAAALLAAAIAGPVTARSATPRITLLTAGYNHTCGLGDDARAYCWGLNGDGRLGTGDIGDRSRPAAVKAPTGVTFTQLSAGGSHTCGLGSDSRAYCWGNGYLGQLGIGDTGNRPGPVAVKAPAGVTFIRLTAGSAHTCGLGSDTRTYCWGNGGSGQLGYGGTAGRSVPVAVNSPAAVAFTELTSGSNHVCALGRNTRAYCWGYGTVGQLGDGVVEDRSTPVTVDAPVGFTQLTASGAHTCGLGLDNKVYCWGYGGSGQLGTGDTRDRSRPVAVNTPAGATFTQLTAGTDYTCGLSIDTRAYCWGNGEFGKLGNGTDVNRLIPVAVGAPAEVVFTQLTAGYNHTCGLGSDNRAYCWGAGNYGQLGDGATGNRPTPGAVLPLPPPPAGPKPPTVITVTPGDEAIEVSWIQGNLGDGLLNDYIATAAPGGARCVTSTTTCVITGLSNGTVYTVTVTADTTAGTATSAPSEPVTPRPTPPPDEQGPVVTVTPGNRTLVRGTHFTTTITASDPAGVDRSYLADPDGADRPRSYATAGVRTGVDGNRTVTWIALDTLGNLTSAARTVIVDNTPPSVALGRTPKDGATVAKATTITASASDRNGIARVQLLVNGRAVATDTRSAYTFRLDPARYGKRFTVKLRAYDRAGNVGYSGQRTYRR